MAAPINAYKNVPLTANYNGTPINHSLAVPDADEATLKARFYFDDIGSYNLEDGTSGFFGVCKVGSTDYTYHNTNRIGALRTKIDGVEAVLYDDAGLNTYPEAIGTGTQITTPLNNVQTQLNYKSAYWVSTDISGYRYRFFDSTINNWGSWIEGGNLGAMPRNTTYSKTAVINLGVADDNARIHGFNIQHFCTNAEGTKYGGIATLHITGIPTIVREGDWDLGTNITFYRDNENMSSHDNICRFFTDEKMVNLHNPTGTWTYYLNATDYITYGYSVPNDTYCILSEGSDVPAQVPPLTFEYQGYDVNSQQVAEDEVLFNTGQNVGTLYLNETTQKAHISYTGTYPNYTFGNYATAGYYSDGSMAFIEDTIYVDSSGTYEYVYQNG